MAYYSKALKSMSSGSAKAPSIFTYKTSDSIAAVTTEGYFDKAGIFFPNDIIYISVNDGANMIETICVQNNRDNPIGEQTSFSLTSSFVGDTRATDTPDYQSDNFGVGMGSAQGVFMQYSYRNNTDNEAAILAADYFLTNKTFLEAGDIIHIVSVDGYFLAKVNAVSSTTVTTTKIVFV